MSNLNSYLFGSLSRMGNDNDYLDQKSIQNVNNSNYLFQSYFSEDTTMKKPIYIATSQPNIFYNGAKSLGQNGYNIRESNKLTIGSLQTHTKCKIDLLQRPFVTVPYLGRGTVDAVVESQMMQGECYTNKKSFNQLSEHSYIKYTNTPLLPSIQESITNPVYLVEGASSDGWIRGGLPSREMTRDNDYYK